MAPVQLTEDFTHAQRFLLPKYILALLILKPGPHLNIQFHLRPQETKACKLANQSVTSRTSKGFFLQ